MTQLPLLPEPAWCAEARRLYAEGKGTFKVATTLQRPASSVWKALHDEMQHKWTPSELAERAPLLPNRRHR